MSLATIIRMEFAYPGVGVLAGDSIQYLSIATAHGVIMVFFMIMPAIFGAFGNFLLPTQLGVHDVAFPRLNSAAFWFLPGGLLMLCQLVCVDRRYQRMNCFNIRELQGILKRKFFTDLVNTSDSHKAMESTLINMRHKNNMSNILMYDQSLFYNFDLTKTSKSKDYSFLPGNIYTYGSVGIDLKSYKTTLNNNNFIKEYNYSLLQYKNYLQETLKDFLSFIPTPTLLLNTTIVDTLYYSMYYVLKSLTNPFKSNYLTNLQNSNNSLHLNNNKSYVIYKSSNVNYLKFNELSPLNYSEDSSTWRFNRNSYPLISYDYKTGNYLSI
jgi:hypothetical protein